MIVLTRTRTTSLRPTPSTCSRLSLTSVFERCSGLVSRRSLRSLCHRARRVARPGPLVSQLTFFFVSDYWKTAHHNPIWAIMGVRCRSEWEMEAGESTIRFVVTRSEPKLICFAFCLPPFLHRPDPDRQKVPYGCDAPLAACESRFPARSKEERSSHRTKASSTRADPSFLSSLPFLSPLRCSRTGLSFSPSPMEVRPSLSLSGFSSPDSSRSLPFFTLDQTRTSSVSLSSLLGNDGLFLGDTSVLELLRKEGVIRSVD